MGKTTALDYRDPEWVAKRLGIDKNAVYRYLAQGILPGLRLGRKWLISEASLLEFLKQEEREQMERRRAAFPKVTDFSSDVDIPYERLSEKASQALSVARDEAIGLNHSYIGTEHILLGLVRDTDGAAALVLSNLGVELATLPQTVESMVERGDSPPSDGVVFDPSARGVIDGAVEEARRLKQKYVDTEHLLLGLFREPEGAGSRVLESLGVTLESVRNEIYRMLPEQKRTQRARKGKQQREGVSSNHLKEFSERARQSLNLAREEALALNHNYLGTEHILLGLARDTDGVASLVLANLGVELDQIPVKLMSTVAKGPEPVIGEPRLSPHAKRVIKLSKEEARHMKHQYVGTEHLLLGLMRNPEGPAYSILDSLGVSHEAAKAEVERVLTEVQPS